MTVCLGRYMGLFVFALALPGCDRMPGKPKHSDRWQPPSAISDFQTLYSQNCLGCHGDGLSIAGSITLKNPVYLQIVPKEVLRHVIACGIPGTNMPAFGNEAGGELSEVQIEALVVGILAWKDPAGLTQDPIPLYAGPLGDVASGFRTFGVYCASCHGVDGQGGNYAGSVVDPTYLALVSNQYLRTVTIAGRPELACPDFAHRVPGRPLDAKSISDLVAWLASQRHLEPKKSPALQTGMSP